MSYLVMIAPVIVAFVVTVLAQVTTTRRRPVDTYARNRYGMDTRGRVWREEYLRAGGSRLYMDGREYLRAGGERTVRRVTKRQSITWES